MEAESLLLEDPYEKAVIDSLREELSTHQKFYNPPVVADGSVANGMHRILAANLQAHANIEVTYQCKNYQEPPGPALAIWELSANVAAGGQVLNTSEDNHEVTYGVLRSFLYNGTWYEALGVGACCGRWEVQWLQEEHPDKKLLLDAVTHQLHRFDMSLVTYTLTQDEL